MVDVKKTALALAITDSELSDEEASILESGGFSVSRATTPQLTDVSEDLDQQSLPSEPEEALSRELGEGEETDLAPPEDLLGPLKPSQGKTWTWRRNRWHPRKPCFGSHPPSLCEHALQWGRVSHRWSDALP